MAIPDRSEEPFPASVKKLFWDVDPRSLSWDQHRDQIIGRVLASGPWETVQWLRSRTGDDVIRTWIEKRKGRGLSPRQLRFWQLVLDLPAGQVDQWLHSEARQVWDRRTHP